jgi:LysR family hydrogen peroxide-inducible transcriptional activator
MELHQIRYVIAVCEEHSFTLAAKRCGVAQPSVTNAIQKLERELRQPLFIRRRRAELTEFGRQVLQMFYQILESCNSIGARLAEPLNSPSKEAA